MSIHSVGLTTVRTVFTKEFRDPDSGASVFSSSRSPCRSTNVGMAANPSSSAAVRSARPILVDTLPIVLSHEHSDFHGWATSVMSMHCSCDDTQRRTGTHGPDLHRESNTLSVTTNAFRPLKMCRCPVRENPTVVKSRHLRPTTASASVSGYTATTRTICACVGPARTLLPSTYATPLKHIKSVCPSPTCMRVKAELTAQLPSDRGHRRPRRLASSCCLGCFHQVH